MRLEYCASCGARLGQVAPCRCEACGADYWANPKPCAGALVVHDGAVLLVRRANEPWLGCWDIPGGFCEAAEHPTETAVRELREETGLEIEDLELLGMWMDRYGESEPPEVTLNIYYLATTADPARARPTAEATEVGWFRPDELPGEIAFSAHARAVLAVWSASV